MLYDIERLIDDIKDSLGYVSLGYSGGQSIDRNYCPICGADDVIKYQTDQVISMGTLDHEESCAYSLIRKLEQTLEKEDSIATLLPLIREDLDEARFPSADEFNAGLERGTEIAIDRIEILIEN